MTSSATATRSGKTADGGPFWWTPRRRSAGALLLMCLAVSAVYIPIEPPDFPAETPSTLLGLDFQNLHVRRLRYAHEALSAPVPYLPGWYTRELGGSPFWSNLQNFPLIPTRLLILLAEPARAFGPAVQIAAVLSAVFMFLFAHRIGIGRFGAAVAGWTFACTGFFASRVFVGHLPLLEAYGALPLLLWLAEVNLQSPPGNRSAPWKLLAAALAAGSVALAGHPQLPVYAFVVTALYVMWRGRNRTGLRLGVASLLGIGLASFVLYPMLLLAGRSTRVLALDPPPNDLAFPYGRLMAFLLPWRDGSPLDSTFHGYPDIAYFWDTVGYVGVLPLMAAVFLGARAFIADDRSSRFRASLFFLLVGMLALLSALPAWHAVMQQVPGTILRSPSRQIYVTTFALALSGGLLVDMGVGYMRSRRWPLGVAAIVLVVAAHGADLGLHDRRFIVAATVVPEEDPHGTMLAEQVGSGRVGVDCDLWVPYNRQIDDVGVFDSLLLAKPYRAILEVTGVRPTVNVQTFNAADLRPRALRFFGVHRVLTRSPRTDLKNLGGDDDVQEYEVPDPMPRVLLVPEDTAMYLSNDDIHLRLGQQEFELANHLLLPADAPRPSPALGQTGDPKVVYRRDSPDRMIIAVTAPWPGYLRLLETWDPGWSASVDGEPAALIRAYDTFMAVPISPGSHEVELAFSTPGKATGRLLSAVCGFLLAALCVLQRRDSRRSRDTARHASDESCAVGPRGAPAPS